MIALMGLNDRRYWSEDDCDFKATWADRFGQDRQRMRELDRLSG